MADISMCKGTDCPLKEKCVRFVVEPGFMQVWFATPPYDKEKKECEYFYPVSGVKTKQDEKG